MVTLLTSQIDELLTQPETGMGYQTIDADVSGRTRRATVYNGDVLLWEDEPRAYLTASVYKDLAEAVDLLEARMIKSIRVVRREPQMRMLTSSMGSAAHVIGRPATDGAPRRTLPGDVFMRFTAYANDRRITAKRGLLPGTYATTEADSRAVETGEQAVERYALPNPLPAKYRFRIDPTKQTPYKEGTVQPADGNNGGGIEVLFYDGTAEDTVSGPKVLPER
jgi:hypothetical protein